MSRDRDLATHGSGSMRQFMLEERDDDWWNHEPKAWPGSGLGSVRLGSAEEALPAPRPTTEDR